MPEGRWGGAHQQSDPQEQAGAGRGEHGEHLLGVKEPTGAGGRGGAH